MDYDVKVYSLMDQHAHSTTSRTPAEMTTYDHAAGHCGRYLASVGKTPETRRPCAVRDSTPLVFSLGGLTEKETASEMTRWIREMTDTVFEAAARRTSLVLHEHGPRPTRGEEIGRRDWQNAYPDLDPHIKVARVLYLRHLSLSSRVECHRVEAALKSTRAFG